MCLYGFANVEKWGRNHGHIWRTTGDIKDRWPRLLANIDINDEKRFTANQGPNIGWNYPDALFIGKSKVLFKISTLVGIQLGISQLNLNISMSSIRIIRIMDHSKST